MIRFKVNIEYWILFGILYSDILYREIFVFNGKYLHLMVNIVKCLYLMVNICVIRGIFGFNGKYSCYMDKYLDLMLILGLYGGI